MVHIFADAVQFDSIQPKTGQFNSDVVLGVMLKYGGEAGKAVRPLQHGVLQFTCLPGITRASVQLGWES